MLFYYPPKKQLIFPIFVKEYLSNLFYARIKGYRYNSFDISLSYLNVRNTQKTKRVYYFHFSQGEVRASLNLRKFKLRSKGPFNFSYIIVNK